MEHSNPVSNEIKNDLKSAGQHVQELQDEFSGIQRSLTAIRNERAKRKSENAELQSQINDNMAWLETAELEEAKLQKRAVDVDHQLRALLEKTSELEGE